MTRLSEQVERRIRGAQKKEQEEYPDGNFKSVIDTGSTLLNLAISAGRARGGGIPGGIMIEVFGPESSGKSALLCEISGDVQRKQGSLQWHDPEGRLDTQFALMNYGVTIDRKDYFQYDTIPEIFNAIRDWKPERKGSIQGIFVDSLAALSTDLEMTGKEGDKMGGRRGKEFSQELRKTCRLLKQKNYILVCSNQLRDTFNAFGLQHESPGGWALRFYPSLRLETRIIKRLTKTVIVSGKEIERDIGVHILIKVTKSSIWKPYRSAPMTILFDYGIDRIRDDLQFIKDYTENTVYTLGGKKLAQSIEASIRIIERDELEQQLRDEVIDLWNEIEHKFDSNRKPKQR